MYNVIEPVGSATTVLVKRLRIHIEKRKGAIIGRLSGVGALWNCVPRVCGGSGGCAGGGVPLGAVLVLSWWGEVSFGGIQSSSSARNI